MFSKKVVFYISLVLLSLFIILEGLTIDPSFLYKTNFSKIEGLYKPIKENNNIKIIAAYPMTLSNGSSGFPRGYQLLGQMVHGKTMVGGLDIVAPVKAEEIYSSIYDISRPESIDALTGLRADTIIIYNQLLDNSGDIIKQLKLDNRLAYLGYYSVSPDANSYLAQNDLSKSFYVFQIKKVIEKVSNHPDVYTDARRLEAVKWDGYTITTLISGISNNDKVYFTQPYSANWKLYFGDNYDPTRLSYVWRKTIFDQSHQDMGGYGNSWVFDKDYIKTNYPQDKYTENSDGSINLEMTIFFEPQSYFYWEWIIAIVTFIFCLGYIGWDFLKKKHVIKKL